MADENGRNGRSAFLPWAQFVWTVGIAIVGGILSGVGSFYSLRENMRVDMAAQIAQMRQQIAADRQRELNSYVSMTTYWALREEIKGSLNDVGRKLDRIEYRLK